MKWLLLLCCFAVDAAGITDDVKLEIDQRVRHEFNPGIALGVYDGGEVAFYVQGWANKEQQIKLNRQSVFEIGSISKTMTALILAESVVDKKTRLDDFIDRLLPAELGLKSPNTVTLKQLATHTSGLPRLPVNQKHLLSADPYAAYDRNDLMEAVREEVIDPAKQQYAYSNYGAGLLGELLSLLYGNSYQELLKERIFEPLNLTNTYADASMVPDELRVTGYAGKTAKPPWHFQALAGAGSVNSSIEDLLSYGVAVLKADNKQLKEAIKLSKKVHYQDKGVALGLGWHIINGVYWHNGGTAGFRSMLMIDPIQHKVVAAITNQAEHPVEDIVKHIVWPDKAMNSFNFPVEISEPELKKFIGAYDNKTSGKTIKTSIKNGQLMLHFPKQPAYQLTYLGNNKFIMKLTKTKVRFDAYADGVYTKLFFKAWGDEQVFVRKNGQVF